MGGRMANQIRRREFIATLGGAAAAWPLVVRAQQGTERPRRIGWLVGLAEEDPEARRRNEIVINALRDLGWIVDRNLHIDYRYTIGEDQHFDAQAAELIALAPDVLFVNNTPATRALQRATAMIPIVFAFVLDPVASGVVTNLARPGGNVTGFTNFEVSMGGKWLGLPRSSLRARPRSRSSSIQARHPISACCARSRRLRRHMRSKLPRAGSRTRPRWRTP